MQTKIWPLHSSRRRPCRQCRSSNSLLQPCHSRCRIRTRWWLLEMDKQETFQTRKAWAPFNEDTMKLSVKDRCNQHQPVPILTHKEEVLACSSSQWARAASSTNQVLLACRCIQLSQALKQACLNQLSTGTRPGISPPIRIDSSVLKTSWKGLTLFASLHTSKSSAPWKILKEFFNPCKHPTYRVSRARK